MNAFLNALPVLANSLADTLGVKVRLNAGAARTDGNTIYLPGINGQDKKSRRLALGYVAHEGSHCRHTDFKLIPRQALKKMILNILEDIRIENAIVQVYPGTKIFLAEMCEELVENGFWSASQPDASSANLMQTFMLYRLRADVLEQKAFFGLADDAEARLRESIPAGMCTKLEALMFQIESCKSTQDALDLASAIITMMEEEAEKEKEQEKQKDQDDQDANQPQPQPSDEDSDDDSQDGSGQGGSSDDDSDSDDDSQDDSGQGDSSDDGAGKKASDVIQSILNAGDEEAIMSTDEAIKEAMGDLDAVDYDEPSNMIPFKNWNHQEVAPDGINIEAEKNRVAAVTNALAVRVQSLMQAQSRKVKRSSMSGMKLNVQNLHRARIDGQIFQKNHEGVKVDTAMAILVDRSGSMSDLNRIQLAMDAVLSTTLAFDRPGIKQAVFAFPAFIHADGQSNTVLKSWDARPASAVPIYKNVGTAGCTPLAQALMGAGIDLFHRKEARKVMLVVTDGDPDSIQQSQWVIDLLRKSGVQVLAVGIMSDAKTVFGQQWAENINDIHQLPKAMIGMLENIMLKRAA